MAGALDGYSAERGQTPNATHNNLLDLRAENLRASRDRVCDIVFVYDYDPVNQTVDVVLANDRGARPLLGIPIAGSGGHGIRTIRAWKGIKQTDKPDIGLLVYPRLGGGRRFLDFVRRDTNAIYARIEEVAIFFGGIPAAINAGETPVGNVVSEDPALHQIGRDDNGLVTPSGAGFMVKDNGDIVIRGRRVYMLGMEQTEADVHAVAREGDTGDGGTGAGPIQGGSGIVFSG